MSNKNNKNPSCHSGKMKTRKSSLEFSVDRKIRLADSDKSFCYNQELQWPEIIKDQAWFRSVTKVEMTDISACGRTLFHNPWCGDCISLIRSRFRDVCFDFTTRSLKKTKAWKSLNLTTTNNSKGKVNIIVLIISSFYYIFSCGNFSWFSVFILYLLFRQGRCTFHVFNIWLRATTPATTPVQSTIPATDASSVLWLSYKVLGAHDGTTVYSFAFPCCSDLPVFGSACDNKSR